MRTFPDATPADEQTRVVICGTLNAAPAPLLYEPAESPALELPASGCCSIGSSGTFRFPETQASGLSIDLDQQLLGTSACSCGRCPVRTAPGACTICPLP
ncbi:hypothetical protein AB0E54_40925, partial [Amycolatopsis coloradensis]|uniref:hypothetical protein n=1 Tax=Amycolatopsis coloradensis TaxID=76021 RepID=UPI0033DA00AA